MAIVAAAVQSFIEDQHSVKPSDLLVLYFSASTLLYIPRLRTLWLIPSVSTARGLWTTIFILTTVTLFVESARKTRMLRPLYQNATKEQMSGFWAQSFYTWVLPFFHTGYSTVLDLSNMPEIDEGLREETAGRRLETSWQKARGRHRLLRATFRAYIWPLVSGIVPRLALTAFTFCQPFLIETTVIFMGSKEKHVPKSHGDALIGAFVLTYLGIAVSHTCWTVLPRLKSTPDVQSSLHAPNEPYDHNDALRPHLHHLPTHDPIEGKRLERLGSHNTHGN